MQALRILFALFAVSLIGCASDSSSTGVAASYDSTEESSLSEPIDDGEPEEVEYNNPKTGYSADYTLDVEHDSDGMVDRINFPSGGYIDSSHIESQEDNGDGTVTVTSDRGQEFTVEMEEPE